MDLIREIFDANCEAVNANVLKYFNLLNEKDFKQKTHMFNGRYENWYLDADKLPGLDLIIDTAFKHAAKILNWPKKNLKAGFWLNSMSPGDVTTAHRHDDDDELLSCVYYIKAPENSGNLIITEQIPANADNRIIIKPKAGLFVFFSPETLHEVSRNESNEPRLSIALNFGLKNGLKN